jgi:hypothetical protein
MAWVRWRACDLIMRLHEEFGISVSDDTVYRALKDLGFAHVSARPRAYSRMPMRSRHLKKTSEPVWRKSVTATAAILDDNIDVLNKRLDDVVGFVRDRVRHEFHAITTEAFCGRCAAANVPERSWQ